MTDPTLWLWASLAGSIAFVLASIFLLWWQARLIAEQGDLLRYWQGEYEAWERWLGLQADELAAALARLAAWKDAAQ